MFNEQGSERYDEEPTDLPITDFMLENIDSYAELNPRERDQAEDVFNKAVVDAINVAEFTYSGDQKDTRGGCFYEVHKNISIRGKMVGFVVKALYDRHNEEEFDKLKREYEVMRAYCPSVVLPTTFIHANIQGRERMVALQREVANGMSLESYFEACARLGKAVPSETKARIDDFISGITKMYDESGRTCDSGWLHLNSMNLLVDPKTDQPWLVDTNMIGHTYGVKEDQYGHNGYLIDLKEYVESIQHQIEQLSS